MIEKLMVKYPESNQLEWNRDIDNFETLRRSDLLISDFSGVLFDYALVFHRPIIYADTAFDPGPYDAWWLKKERIWVFDVLPRIGRQLTKEQFNDLKTLIDEMLEASHYQDAIDQARREAWVCVGQSVDRIVDYMIKKRSDLLQREGNKVLEINE